MATEKDILVEFLSKALNLDKSGVTSLIYEEDGAALKSDALTILEGKQKEFIASQRLKFDDGHKAGTRETMEKLEKDFKKKTGFKSDAEGVDLFTAYADSKVAEVKAGFKPNELTDDDVRKHKLFLDMEGKLAKSEEEKAKAVEAAVAGAKSEFQKIEMLGEVKKRAAKQLIDMKPILSEDATRKENQMKLLYSELDAYDFQGRSDGEVVLIKKDGKPLEDDMGHAMTLSKFVASTAPKYYDFQQSDPRNAPPPKTGDPAPSFKLVKPTSQGEFLKQYDEIQKNDSLTPEQKTQAGIDLKKLYKGEPVTQ